MKYGTLIFLVLAAMLMAIQPVFAQDADDDSEIDITIDVDDSEAVADDIVDLTVGTTESTTEALDDFLERLINQPKSELMQLLLVIGGVILLVGGWRVYDWVVVIAGFVIGAALALSLLTTDSTLISVAAILTGGLIGAFVAVYLFVVGVFVIGAYIGIVLTGAILGQISTDPISPLVLLIGGLIGGLILASLSFQFLVIVSAVVGAQMLVLGLGLESFWIIVLAIASIILQLYLIRHYNYSYRRRPANPLRRVFA